MYKWFTLFCFFIVIVFSSPIYSQPVVSYIIPDIGAPAMNVYVEFVAPYNAKGTFGADGFYLNNSNDAVRIVPANKNDTAKIKIGPVIVSWNGRLISTQIFILPTLKPNSEEALIVSPEFRIPLVVVANGQRSNQQMFYIVKSRPYFDGTSNTTDLVFGEGMFGSRSPRGALIYDSLKLGNRTYTVSTRDCDPNTDGQQGYLPFTLLVRGKITGEANTIISADAVKQSGGPGGAGGGGRFYDAFLFGGNNIGSDGGNGFVGGGAGGRNSSKITGINDAYKNPGAGTGINGNSMNGVTAPVNMAYESAAGGTGHPFGLSGTSCSDGNNCNPPGGFGGGSGRPQNTQGGSAGYAFQGQGAGGGLPVGNKMNVPVAGGGGGAGGNPNSPDGYSGDGGGGGGAMTIFGYEIKNLYLTSKGSSGENSSGGIGSNVAHGGNGSGGMVNVLSKGLLENIKISVDGGTKNSRIAGAGRVRFDGLSNVVNSVNVTTIDASEYKGITTDTTQYSGYNIAFTGTQAMPGQNISSSFYIADFYGDWINSSEAGFTDPANGKWNAVLISPKNKKYMCLVAVQDVPSPKTDEFEQEPLRIMSQAGANLFILDLAPILVADAVAENKAVTCIGYERFIETIIKNDDAAGGVLELNFSNNKWVFGNNGFEIVSPLGDVQLNPGAAVVLKVKYQWTGGSKTNISNRLLIPHNDPDVNKKNPWAIDFKVGDAYQPRMIYTGQPEDFIFPDTRIGGKNSKNMVLKNTGDADLRIETINPIDPPFYFMGTDKTLPVILKPGEELRVNIEFRPTEEKDYTVALITNSIVTDTTCAFFAFQELKGKGVISSIDVSTMEIDFGLVAWCKDSVAVISIKNPASATASFTLTSAAVIEGDDPGAFVITNPKNPPITITPDDGTQFNIRINGKQAGVGVKKAVFRIQTDVPETPVIEVTLKAEIIGFDVSAAPNPINLGAVEIGFDINSSTVLKNSGRLSETIKSITSNNPASFTFSNSGNNVISPNGDFLKIDFKIDTKLKPVNNEIIVAFDNPCDDTLRIPVNFNYIETKESAMSGTQNLFTDSTVTDTLDFGKFSPCYLGVLKFILFTNTSQGRYIVLNEELKNSGSSLFNNVTTGLVYPDTIPPSPNQKGGMQIFFNPDKSNEGIYYNEYIATLYLNGKIVKRKIVLKAEIIDINFDYTPPVTNFLTVTGMTDSGELIIKNIGSYNVEITGFTPPADPAFSVNGSILGVTINPGSEQKFSVVFAPGTVKLYNDSIVVKILVGGCEREFTFYLNGEGIPSMKLHLYIPHLVVNPDINEFSIPVYGKLDKADANLDEFKIESMKVTMRRSMFYPKSISEGTLINSSLSNDDRIMEFKIDNVKISASDSIVALINGATLLGDSAYTDIIISDIQYSQKSLVGEITSENGSLKTLICSEGGDRLLKIQTAGSSVSVNPNPANGIVSISVNSIEKGSHKITVMDISGNEMEISGWTNPTSGNYERTEIINAGILTSGNYVLKLYTPTEVILTTLIIIK